MRWSFRFARIAGIDLKVHWSFILILIWGALMFRQQGPAGWAFGAAMMLLLFACVTLHELGHSLVAQRLSVPVRQIVLLPIGGVALMSRNPDRPLHELLIAIAGPIVNVVIAIILASVVSAGLNLSISGAGDMLTAFQPSLALALVWLLAMNVVLVLFNLIPAFPLDGGRMLRALLAMVMTYPRATRIAARVGQVLAILLGLAALFTGNFWLVIFALFIFFGAGAESAAGQARTVLSTLRVGDAYNKHALTLSSHDRISGVVDYILTSYQRDFAVMHGADLIGIVTREHILQHLGAGGADLPVIDIMQRRWLGVDAAMPLDQVATMLSPQNARVAAVYDRGTYLGLVSIEDIQEAYAVLSFVRRGGDAPEAQEFAPPPPPPPTARPTTDHIVT